MLTSKNLWIVLLTVFFIGAVSHNATAGERKERKAREMKQIEEMIGSKTYRFVADRVTPMSYLSKTLSSDYDLQVTPEGISAYLPYIGKVHAIPVPESVDMGIKFTCTDYLYDVNKTRKGWDVVIKTNDGKPGFTLTLSVSESGMCHLVVADVYRQPITFTGELNLE